MPSFFSELKRRNVFKVGVAYLIVAWLAIQVAAIVLPTFNSPQWVMQVFTFFMILGFPIALILAWAFEATPEGVKRDTGTAAVATGPATASNFRSNFRLSFGLVVALLLGVLIGITLGDLDEDPAMIVETLHTPIQITANPTNNAVASAAISPDGRYLAYKDNSGLQLRIIDSGETHLLSLPAGFETDEMEIAWYPDSAYLLIRASVNNISSLWRLAVLGGEPRQLVSQAREAAVSPDGKQIAYLTGFPARAIYVMGPQGESPQKIHESDNNAIWKLAWSPDSQWLLYGTTGSDMSIGAINISSGVNKTVIADPRLWQSWRGTLPFHWAPDGRLLFAMADLPPNDDASNLWQINIDSENAETRGTASKITQLTEVNFDDISMTSDGSRLAFLLEHNQQDVYVGELFENDRKLTEVRRLSMDERDDVTGGWMANGEELLYTSERGRNSSLFRQHVDQIEADLVASGAGGINNNAEMSPDGQWILYWENNLDNPGRQLMRIPVDGGGAETVFVTSSGRAYFRCPGRAGPTSDCILGYRDDDNRYTFRRFHPVYGEGVEVTSVTDRPPFLRWDLSPDGRYVAMVHNDGPARIIDLESGNEREISREGWILGEFVSWSVDSQGLFMDGSNVSLFRKALVYVPLDGNEVVVLRKMPNEWHTRPRVSPDGRYLAFGLMVFTGNAWMIENP